MIFKGSLIFLLLWSGCFWQETNPTLVTVGPLKIGVLDYNLIRPPEETDEKLSLEVKMELINSMVDEKLLVTAAIQDGIQVSNEELDLALIRYSEDKAAGEINRLLGQSHIDPNFWRERQREKLMVVKWFEKQIEKAGGIPEKKKRDYYKDHTRDFFIPLQVRARHIMVTSLEKAKELRERLLKGENFITLARQYSESADAQLGGDLGAIEAGTHPIIFEETCFKLEVGEISGIVRTGYGYHIFKVIEKSKDQIAPYEKVLPSIEEHIQEEMVSQIMNRTVAALRKAILIRYNETNINKLR